MDVLQRAMAAAQRGKIVDLKIDTQRHAELKAENAQLHAANERHVETVRQLRVQVTELTVRNEFLVGRLPVSSPHRGDVPSVPKTQPLVAEIINAVARRFGVRRMDILSHRRTADVVGPRQVVMYLATHMTLLSSPEIGRRLGGRDHTTVLYGAERIEERRGQEPELDEHIRALQQDLRHLVGDDCTDAAEAKP